MTVPLPEHLWQITLFALLILGPVPVIMVLGRYWARLPIAERLAAWLVTWCAIQMVVGQVLGHLGLLRLEMVLGVYGAMAVFVAGLAHYGWVPITRMRWAFSGLRFSQWELVLIGVAAIVAVAVVGKLLVFPTIDYDSLNYHLPVMARWHNTQSLVMEKWQREQFLYFPEYYPYTWEMLGTLFLLPFNEDLLVMLPNVLAWALLGLSVWSILTRLRVSPLYAMTGVILLLTAPVVINLMFTLHVDLAMGAFLLTGLAFLLAYHDTRRAYELVMAWVALAIACGIKTTGLAYTVILLFGTALILAWPRTIFSQFRRSMGRFTLASLALIGGCLLLGGGWYIRNWLQAGNPLYPIRLAVGSFVLFPGVIVPSEISRTTLAAMFDVARAEHWNALLSALNFELGSPGILLLALGLVGVFAVVTRWRSAEQSREKRLIVLLCGITLLLYLNSPFSGDNGANQFQVTPWIGNQMRFAVSFFGLWSIIAVLGAKALRLSDKILALTSLVIVAWTLYQIAPAWLLIGVGWIGLMLIGMKLKIRLSLGPKRLMTRRLCLVAGLTAIVLISFAIRQAHDAQRLTTYGDTQDWLDAHLTGSDRLGYVLALSKYLLYGRHLDRDNKYIPLAAAQTQAEWLAVLRAEGITHFAIGPLRPEWLGYPQVSWLEDARFFEKVKGSDASREIVIYRLKSGTS